MKENAPGKSALNSRPSRLTLAAVFLFLNVLSGCLQVGAQNDTDPSPGSSLPQIDDACSVSRPRRGGDCMGDKSKALSNPLLEAIEAGNIEKFKSLLAQGAEVDVKGENGTTPLLLAAGYRDLEMMESLLEKGANPNLQSDLHETPLMTAAFAKCTKIIEALLAAGADANLKSDYGYTALDNAARYNNIEGVKLLLKAGADLYAGESRSGERSAFISAVGTGNLEMVKLILAADHDKKLEPFYDIALRSAASSPSTEMLKFLLQLTVKNQKIKVSDAVLTVAAMRNNPETVKLLLAAGANPKAHSPQTAAAITWASTYGYTEIVKLLIAAGADVNVRDNWPPLVTAARGDHVETMDVLLKAGIKIDQRSSDGETALMFAVREGNPQSVKFLIEKGADLNLIYDISIPTGYEKMTILAYALKYTKEEVRSEIVQLLTNAGAGKAAK